MSIFQDIMGQAQSLIGQPSAAPGAAAPQNAPVQPPAAPGAPIAPGQTAKPGEWSSISNLFGNFSDTVLAGFGDLHKRESDEWERTPNPEREREHRRKFDAIKDSDVRAEAERQFRLDPANKDKPFSITQDEVDQRKHGKMISNEYKSQTEIQSERSAQAEDPGKPIGDLTSTEARMKFLNGFTQNQNMLMDKQGKEISEHACAPTSVIAAAVAMDGQAGLTPIVERLEKDLQGKSPAERKKYAALKEKIKNNELTSGDIQNLQEDLYTSMHNSQVAQRKKNGDKSANDVSISVDTVNSYLSSIDTTTDPEKKQNMLEKMKTQGLEIRGIDNDGDRKPNHAVLDMHGAVTGTSNGTAIFDPYSRKGGQLIMRPEQLQDYYKTVSIGTLPKERSPFDLF